MQVPPLFKFQFSHELIRWPETDLYAFVPDPVCRMVKIIVWPALQNCCKASGDNALDLL